MKTLKESQEDYKNRRLEIERVYKRIRQREAQIVRLDNKASKLRENTYWGEILIRPIIELLKVKFPEITEWDDERLTPLGMCSRVSIFPKYKEETLIICFTPTDLENGVISYDTEENTKEFPKGSLGYFNDMGKEAVAITDIEQVFNHIQKQITLWKQNQQR